MYPAAAPSCASVCHHALSDVMTHLSNRPLLAAEKWGQAICTASGEQSLF